MPEAGVEGATVVEFTGYKSVGQGPKVIAIGRERR